MAETPMQHPQEYEFGPLPEIPKTPEQPKVVQHPVQEMSVEEIQQAAAQAEAQQAAQAQKDEAAKQNVWEKIKGIFS